MTHSLRHLAAAPGVALLLALGACDAPPPAAAPVPAAAAPAAAAAAAPAAAAVARAEPAAFDWNGTWGRRAGPGAGVIIQGEQVRYFWNGNEVPVTNLRVTPQEIRFDVVGPSGRVVILTPARGGRMTFTTSARNEPRSSFQIWRG